MTTDRNPALASAYPPDFAAMADADQLFRAYPKLAGWVRRLVDDDETAHEVASEASLSARSQHS